MVAQEERKNKFPDFSPGDTVKVHMKVVEGESERIQIFEGTVILKRGSGDSQSFTVRKVSFGVGVERTFPLLSPHVDKIEVVRVSRVRRARLYYLRQLTGKAARLSEVAPSLPKPDAAAFSHPAKPAPEPKAKASGDSGAGVQAMGAASLK